VVGGTFTMGSDQDDFTDNPAHLVSLDTFAIGKYEVTVAQFQRFIEETGYVTTAEQRGHSPVYRARRWAEGPQVNWRYDVHGHLLADSAKHLPVVHVSWTDAEAYCRWLSQKTGVLYRLPTEAEWEFAARGGVNPQRFDYSGSDRLQDVAWYFGNAQGTLHPPGQKQANALGIYDMSGNASEWCQDWYQEKGYKRTRNRPGSLGREKVLRGGAWGTAYEAYCLNASRYKEPPEVRGGNIGFRICQPAP
jgi:formylglycine-generating enzyme required for sulfatase activity